MRLGTVLGVVLVVLVLTVAVVVAAVTLTDDGEEPTAAVAFDADALTEPPTTRWITNGGTLFNERYSPLDQINIDNVGRLKGLWHTDLRGAGIGGKAATGPRLRWLSCRASSARWTRWGIPPRRGTSVP